MINRDEILLLFRYPNYQFRPSHSDALHIDFWLRGQNLFRDSGTYGYFSKDISDSYFESTEAHNTVQFDYRDQMPRLGRFLYGKWIETNDSNMDGANRLMIKKDFDDMYKVFNKWMNEGIFHIGHRRAQYPPSYRYRDNVFFNSA